MKITLTDECYHVLGASGMRDGEGLQQPNGEWLVELADHRCKRLQELAQPGESYSDTLMRGLKAIAVIPDMLRHRKLDGNGQSRGKGK